MKTADSNLQCFDLNQDIEGFHQNVMNYNSLAAKDLLSIIGPMSAKLENTATIVDII